MCASQNHERIEALGDQLRAKISSKFNASIFLAGFALTILSGQVFTLWQSPSLPALFPLAIGTVTAAVVLFVAAVLHLDALTMPKRFWIESDAAGSTGHPRDGYLLDSDLWELRKHMIFYWTRLTLVATAITGLAALMMLVPLPPMTPQNVQQVAFMYAVLGGLVALGYLALSLMLARNTRDENRRLRPLLREQD